MCSNNTSSRNYGELQLHDENPCSCPKKQKKKNKVRLRGPGVAELEKIRLQEEHKSPVSSSSPSLPNIDHHMTLFAPSCDIVMTPPNFALPSLPGFPFSYGSLISPAPVIQRKQHSLTMNLSNPPLREGRFYQFIEPPSNQRSCVDSVSQFLEEENKKMVMSAKKRPWPLLTDTTEPSFGPAASISLRDVIPNRLHGTSPVQDSGTTIPIIVDSSTSIPSFPRHYPRFIPLGLQYKQQQQQKDFDENMQWRSKKPFYSFMPSQDQSNADRERQPCDRYESATEHGIDLSLKL